MDNQKHDDRCTRIREALFTDDNPLLLKDVCDHLKACPACRSAYKQLSSLQEKVRSVMIPPAPLEAVRDRIFAKVTGTPVSRPWQFRDYLAPVSTLAVVFLTFSCYLFTLFTWQQPVAVRHDRELFTMKRKEAHLFTRATSQTEAELFVASNGHPENPFTSGRTYKPFSGQTWRQRKLFKSKLFERKGGKPCLFTSQKG